MNADQIGMPIHHRKTLNNLAKRLRVIADAIQHGEAGYAGALEIMESQLSAHFDCIALRPSESDAVAALYYLLSEE